MITGDSNNYITLYIINVDKYFLISKNVFNHSCELDMFRDTWT